jgi:hypothetical protein
MLVAVAPVVVEVVVDSVALVVGLVVAEVANQHLNSQKIPPSMVVEPLVIGTSTEVEVVEVVVMIGIPTTIDQQRILAPTT